MNHMNKRRILLVEDEKVVAADIQECVKGLGYDVVGTAGTGAEALRLAVNTAPDLVLMDIKLQGAIDGIDVAGASTISLRFRLSISRRMPTPKFWSAPS